MVNRVRVLLLSTTTGYQLRSFGDAAGRLGIELVLATDRCHHLDDPWRDGAIPVRFHDEDASLRAVLAAAEARPLSGVLAVGDRPTGLAARVARALDLPGNDPEGAEASRSKKEMRRRFVAAGMRAPWFVELAPDDDLEALAARIAYPCVVKPLGLSGSRGVIKAESPADLQAAVRRVRTLLARPELRAQRSGLDDTLLVEGFIDGHEYAIEGVLTGGTLRVLALFDKPEPLDGPFFEESIYVTPSGLLPADQQAIAEEVQRATRALGLQHGPVHAECRVGRDGVTMLEVAARPIGGLCSKVLRFESDGSTAPLEELLLRHARGEDVSGFARERAAAAVMMIPIPRRGIYKRVRGERGAKEVAYVEDVRVTAKPDQLLEPLPEGGSYLGFIFSRAPEPAAAVAALRDAHARLTFEIDPALRVIRETLNAEG